MDNIDRRIKVNFRTLDERQESKITSELINYLIWYKRNKKEVDEYIKKSGKEVDDTSIVEFWIQRIGKSKEIEDMLKSMDVLVDCFEYVKKYKNKIFILQEYPEKFVCTKEYYRTEEQAIKIRTLLEKFKDHPEIKEIKKYLKKYCYDADHITYDYAERIINKCSNLSNN